MSNLEGKSEKGFLEQEEPRKKRACYIGMPEMLKLEMFGSIVWDHFGGPPYLVGSSLERRDFRDVDVRVILDDEDFERFCGKRERPDRLGGMWSSLCLAFSALGRELTGLPIDFQIQRMDKANEEFGGRPRNAIGLIAARRFVEPETKEE